MTITDDRFACEMPTEALPDTRAFPPTCHHGNDEHERSVSYGWCCAPAEPGSKFCYLHAEWGQS